MDHEYDKNAALHRIQHEVLFLRTGWRYFRQLFGHSTERVVLLERFTEGLFTILRIMMTESLVLVLTRLTDPTETGDGRNKNLVLARLIDDTDFSACPELRAIADNLLEKLRREVKKCRARRNKQGAHLDLEVSLGHGKLEDIQCVEINEAVKLASKILDVVAQARGIAHNWTERDSNDRSVDSLHALLKWGIERAAENPITLRSAADAARDTRDSDFPDDGLG